MSNARYRGKRVSDGEFVIGNLVNAVNGKVYIVTMWDNTGTYEDRPRIMFVEVIPETVGQYTGMEDKSRNEIYEGDKVVVCDDEYGTIAWENCEFIVLFDTWAKSLSEFYPRELEVIGNIHDNPEYLEVPHDR